ncbi:MAG: hypothetical protein V4506_15985 [Bacteroidota bacterium]
MNYKLIHHEGELQKFIDFLPELTPNEGYFIILIARKKWYPESGIPSARKLKRETVLSKDKIIATIRQWEITDGFYTAGELPIHQMNLGVYIGFNPKNQHNACFELINQCLAAIKSNSQNINVKAMASDVIQGSNGTKNFIDIDVDIKEGENYLDIVDFIKSVVNESHLTFIKTNGGFHCLIRLPKTEKMPTRTGADMHEVIKVINEFSPHGNNWYQLIKNHSFKSELNIMSNDLIPIVGCNQGKSIPYFLNS